jgi:hypothetical protein
MVVLSDVLGVGAYADALSHIQHMAVAGQTIPLLDLPTLIATKEAAADPNPRKRAALDYLRQLHQR